MFGLERSGLLAAAIEGLVFLADFSIEGSSPFQAGLQFVESRFRLSEILLGLLQCRLGSFVSSLLAFEFCFGKQAIFTGISPLGQRIVQQLELSLQRQCQPMMFQPGKGACLFYFFGLEGLQALGRLIAALGELNGFFQPGGLFAQDFQGALAALGRLLLFGQFLRQGFLFFRAEQLQVALLLRQGFQLLLLGLVALESSFRQLGVNLRAGDALQQVAALFFPGFEEGGKIALRQHHRAAEAAVVQTSSLLDGLIYFAGLFGNDLKGLLLGGPARQLAARAQDVALGLAMGAPDAPLGAID